MISVNHSQTNIAKIALVLNVISIIESIIQSVILLVEIKFYNKHSRLYADSENQIVYLTEEQKRTKWGLKYFLTGTIILLILVIVCAVVISYNKCGDRQTIQNGKCVNCKD